MLASTGSRVCFDVAASLCCCCNSCRAWGGWREGSDNSCCASVGVVVKLGGTLMLRFMQGGGEVLVLVVLGELEMQEGKGWEQEVSPEVAL